MAKDGFGNIVSDSMEKLVKDLSRSNLPGAREAASELTHAQVEQQVRDEFYNVMLAIGTMPVDKRQVHLDNIQIILRTYESPNFERFLRTGQAGNALEDIQLYRRAHHLY